MIHVISLMRMRNWNGCKKTRHSGFTLLEVLISITLVAVIVVILSMAFRSGVRAYTRGKEMNRRLVVLSSIAGLLDRQLRTVVQFTGALNHYAWFEGKEQEISFVTTCGPMSTQAGGLLLVFYRFNDKTHSLIYGQKIVLAKKDIRDGIPDNIAAGRLDDYLGDGWDINIVQGISEFALGYAETREDISTGGTGAWSDQWSHSGKIPVAISLSVGFSDNNDDKNQEDEDPEDARKETRVFYTGFFGAAT